MGVWNRNSAAVSRVRSSDAIDPFIVVDAADIPRALPLLEDRTAAGAFDLLNCISGTDYLELDLGRAKAGFEPHLEVVYHLSSFTTGTGWW